MGDVGAIAPIEHLDLAAFGGMLTKVLENRARCGAAEAALAATGLLFRNQGDGAVDADREHVLDRGKIDVGLLLFGDLVDDEGTKATKAGDNGAAFGVLADFARQPQQLQGMIEIDGGRIDAFGNG